MARILEFKKPHPPRRRCTCGLCPVDSDFHIIDVLDADVLWRTMEKYLSEPEEA